MSLTYGDNVCACPEGICVKAYGYSVTAVCSPTTFKQVKYVCTPSDEDLVGCEAPKDLEL